MSNSASNSQAAFAVRQDRNEGQDLLQVGQQCSHPACMLVDFLPIKCTHCSAPYCQEHFHPEQHSCEKWDARAADRRALECPLCSTLIAIPPGEDPNVRMGLHVDECFATAATGKSTAKASSVPVCARARCDKKLWAPIQCEKCKQKFCATHRHPASHTCAVETPVALDSRKQVRVEPTPSSTSPIIPVKSAAAMAAFKRSMNEASAKVSSKVTAAAAAAIPSSTSKSTTASPSKPKQAASMSASPSQSSSVASGSKDSRHKNVFSSTDRRATAERKSQLRSMQERHKKGLLSKTEVERLKALQAEVKEKDDCVIM